MPLDNKVSDIMQELRIDQPSELSQAFKQINDDSPSPDTKMSNMDMNARLSNREKSAILGFDELRRQGILPKDATLSQQAKRLSVSLNGMGRAELVDIAIADREQKSGARGGSFFKRLFQPR